MGIVNHGFTIKFIHWYVFREICVTLQVSSEENDKG